MKLQDLLKTMADLNEQLNWLTEPATLQIRRRKGIELVLETKSREIWGEQSRAQGKRIRLVVQTGNTTGSVRITLTPRRIGVTITALKKQ